MLFNHWEHYSDSSRRAKSSSDKEKDRKSLQAWEELNYRGTGKELVLTFPSGQKMTINARIKVDHFKFDRKDFLVSMQFTVMDEASLTAAQNRRGSGMFVRVKRGLRNSTIINKQ